MTAGITLGAALFIDQGRSTAGWANIAMFLDRIGRIILFPGALGDEGFDQINPHLGLTVGVGPVAVS
jgi:hypothetical protein